jgi:hypothetical protein
MSSLLPVLMVVVFIAIAGLAMWGAFLQSRKAMANLQALAQRLGFEYRAQDRTVTGHVDGRVASFYKFTTGSGKSTQTWRAVAVYPEKTGSLTFNLHRQGLLTKVEALFGAHEATVGDAAFDRAWFLQTSDPEFLGAALVPEVREKLMAALAAGGQSISFRLEKGMVRYAELGSFSSEPACARLERMLPVLTDLAAVAEVAADGGGKKAE